MRSTYNSKQNIFKIKPSKFIISMKKNGMIPKEIELLNNIDEFTENLDSNTKAIVHIFKPFNRFNVNFIYYVNIFKQLTLQQLKNFYRFFIIKWNLIKNKTDIKAFHIKYDLEYIYSIVNYNDLLEKSIQIYSDFIELGDFYFLLFINTFHEYLSPNT